MDYYFFKPDSNYNDIKEQVEVINKSKCYVNARNAVVIASHDDFGLRNKICCDVEKIIPITYAGKWKNTTNELWEKYKNDKELYLKNFKFNICAENMNAPYYVTEKLFDAFKSGIIPIYHGANNNPEPNIINKNRIIFGILKEIIMKTLSF